MDLRRRFVFPMLSLVILLVLAACQASASGEPSVEESASAEPSARASESEAAEASETPRPTGDATVDGPDEVSAGTTFEVAWTGPDVRGDYVAILTAGGDDWTNEEYFYTYEGNPGTLIAPPEAGDYELLYIAGDEDETVLAREPIEVTEFEGSIEVPPSVGTGDPFDVAWTGPDSNGDYVTILAQGVTDWTNEDYFYTYEGNPSALTAPDAPGNYVVWYVLGLGEVLMASDAIQVTP